MSDSSRFHLLSFFVGVLVWGAVSAQAQTHATVTVSDQVAGQTPALVGYNVGHFYPGSNTAAWWAYSGVNAARMWSNPSYIEPSGEDDLAPWGDGVYDLASFNARRQWLRADPLNPSLVNWAYFANNYASQFVTGNNMYLAYALETLTGLGIAFNITQQRSETSYPWRDAATQEGWADRWEHWQHHYAQAFHLARYYNVERFQMCNEPNHSAHETLSQAEYLQRLQFASDAFQCAVQDVNRLFGKHLAPRVHAPVSAGGHTVFHANPGGDPRDDTLGWGELVIRNRHYDYTGTLAPGFDLIRTYAYQQYNLTGPGFASELVAIQTDIAAESGGEAIKVALTEFNVHNAATFAAMSETLDTPSKLVRMGSILSNLANAQPDELYVFKFSQTSWESGVKKNGTHFVSNDVEPYNVGGVTKGGQVVRSFARGFAGGRPLLVVPTTGGAGGGDLRLGACREQAGSRYFILCTNVSETADLDVSLDLAAWKIPAGVVITVEEVSPRFHGEISGLLVMDGTGVVRFVQRAASVLLLTVPTRPAASEITLTAVDDTTVRAGVNANTNYGQDVDLAVKANRTDPGARSVSLIKFDLGAIGPAAVEQAVLKVTGHNPRGSTVVIGHVYGIQDSTWQEEAVTWNTASNLGNAMGHNGSGTVENIADNFIEGAGQTASIVGHLSADATPAELMLDVTDFVRRGTGRYVSFLIAREVRFDGDVDDVNHLRIASKEDGASTPPRLLLRTSCGVFSPVSPAPGPLPAGATSVQVINVDPSAEWVKVYADGTTLLGAIAGSPPVTPSTIDVTVTPPLVSGDAITATEVIGGIESCLPGAGSVIVDNCADVPEVSILEGFRVGDTVVTVSGVAAVATQVAVYANGTTLIGVASGNGTSIVQVTVAPLVFGDGIMARQTLNGVASCMPSGVPVPGTISTLATDGFGDGDRDNNGTPEGPVDDPGDVGLAWHKCRYTTDPILSVAHDPGGIGDDNALWIDSTAVRTYPVASLPSEVVLDEPGEFIRLAFEVRVNGPVPSYRDILRFGLFHDQGTRVEADQPDVLLIDYDAGYFATLTTGAPTTSNERLVRNDPSGNQAALWGMSVPDEQLFNASPAAHRITDNDPHTVSLTITRSAAGGAFVELTLDGATAMSAEDTSTSGGPLFAFNEVSIGAVGSGTAILDYVIDDVQIVVALASTTLAEDMDADGDVDLSDFGIFQSCFNGPNRAAAASCGADADFDNDADVDLADFGLFQGCFNGPNRPPACE